MTKSFYVVSFLTVFVLSVGAMFEFFHWPYAGILMLIGFALLNLAAIPMFFYQKYQKAI